MYNANDSQFANRRKNNSPTVGKIIRQSSDFSCLFEPLSLCVRDLRVFADA